MAVNLALLLHPRRHSPLHPPCTNGTNGGGGYTGAIRCTGGISRASRRAKVSIRRITPVQPPAISAENRHKL
ncbi:MAG: hypothetical protein ABI970_02225 [Chloroflexota bacterium]